MLTLKYKIWLEQEGRVFGKGPMDILNGIKEYGSLSEAARQLHMSYNKAFTLIKDIEKRLGHQLIVTHKGGAGGGYSSLTNDAEMLIQRYTLFIEECDQLLNEAFQKYFSGIDI